MSELGITEPEAARLASFLSDLSGIPAPELPTPPVQIVPAAPGWRIAVIGPDEELEACPIVAWANRWEDTLTLEPIARPHAGDGIGVAASLWAGRPSDVVGILAPGEELNGAWVEAGAQVAAANREAADREGA